MTPSLPPKDAPPTPENVRALREGLTSVIAGHPGSKQLWTFYDVIEEYLGPWHEAGYPIGYGKYYCILFSENEKLSADPAAKEWVRKTTIGLQESLRDFIVARFQQGTLNHLSEKQLRDAAFKSHSVVYLKSGLAQVILIAPELIPVIFEIPAKEFVSDWENVKRTWTQVWDTGIRVPGQASGALMAAAMPAHSGLFRMAAARDASEFQFEMQTSVWLNHLERELRAGKLDNIGVLNRLTSRLNATQFGDQQLARRAFSVVVLANQRKHIVAAYYRKLIKAKSRMKASVDQNDPNWSRW